MSVLDEGNDMLHTCILVPAYKIYRKDKSHHCWRWDNEIY